MAFRNGSLIPGLGYGHYPSTSEEQRPSLASAPAIMRLQQRHQSERPGELPAVVEPTNTEITIGQSTKPQILKSIDDLAALSAAIDAFKRQYDDLQKHMDYIDNAIDSELKSNGIDLSASSPPQEVSSKGEGQHLCELMCSKGLRKYIYANICDRAKLMEEIPEALKLAKEPAKFVLECIGKFYLQGRRAFAKDSPMIPARQVSLLILESFLLMLDPGEDRIESSIKDQAETAAVAWRKRLMGEGGLAAADQMDARGLLLLIASFGVPSNFRNLDLFDLIRQSGSSEIAAALRRSPFLAPMISGVVESSIKRGMHLEALDLVFTFGMEDRFPASSLIISYLRMSKESFERAKRKANSPMAFKEAIEKQLAALTSVVQCLEAHKLDPAKEVPGWQIKEQMVKLENDTLQLNKQMEDKAISVEEVVLTKSLCNQQMKRPRLSPMEMPPPASSSYSPIYRDQSYPSHRDEDRDEISALVSSYLGPSSSFSHRRRSPDYILPPGGLGRNVSAYEHLPPNSYSPPVHRHRLPQHHSPPIHGLQHIPYGLQHIPYGLQRVYRHSPSVERYLGLPDHRSPRNSSPDHRGGM